MARLVRVLTTMNSNLRDTCAYKNPTGARSDTPARVERRSSFAAVLENVGPNELTDVAKKGDLEAFSKLYNDTLLLMVRIRAVDMELYAGLSVTAIRDDASVPLEPIAKT